jgi:hypothetical protein
LGGFLVDWTIFVVGDRASRLNRRLGKVTSPSASAVDFADPLQSDARTHFCPVEKMA